MARPYTSEERKIKKAEFLEAFEESKGMTTTSCMRVGLTKDTVIAWRKKDKKFDEAITAIQEKNKEWVEGKLMTLVERGNTAAIMFYLKCKCGYQEKQKIEVEQTGQIDIKAEIEALKEQLKDENE